MKECPQCHKKYGDHLDHCTADGTALIPLDQGELQSSPRSGLTDEGPPKEGVAPGRFALRFDEGKTPTSFSEEFGNDEKTPVVVIKELLQQETARGASKLLVSYLENAAGVKGTGAEKPMAEEPGAEEPGADKPGAENDQAREVQEVAPVPGTGSEEPPVPGLSRSDSSALKARLAGLNAPAAPPLAQVSTDELEVDDLEEVEEMEDGDVPSPQPAPPPPPAAGGLPPPPSPPAGEQSPLPKVPAGAPDGGLQSSASGEIEVQTVLPPKVSPPSPEVEAAAVVPPPAVAAGTNPAPSEAASAISLEPGTLEAPVDHRTWIMMGAGLSLVLGIIAVYFIVTSQREEPGPGASEPAAGAGPSSASARPGASADEPRTTRTGASASGAAEEPTDPTPELTPEPAAAPKPASDPPASVAGSTGQERDAPKPAPVQAKGPSRADLSSEKAPARNKARDQSPQQPRIKRTSGRRGQPKKQRTPRPSKKKLLRKTIDPFAE